MTDNGYIFDIKPNHKSIIKVIGVGGGGSNAVNHMYNLGIRDVDFFVCNTDVQALQSSPVPNKLQIGVNLTGGLGAGANPEKGKGAALESKEQIRELLNDGTKMVFITAGMGGGTGTGAAPIIAKVAKEMDILTVGIITAPFSFEGRKKMKLADAGIEQLKHSCDTVLVILNDKLREIYGNLTISNAFAQADNILTTAAKSIAEIITVPGYVNVDFEDVKTVMSNAGTAVMGSAITEGDDRARRAAEMAITSPLLDDKDIHGAQKILLSIMSGEQAELQINELTEITDYIQEIAGDDAEMIFGHGIDPDLGESIRVTVITTGFDKQYISGESVFEEEEEKKRVFDLDSSKPLNGYKAPSVVKDNVQTSFTPPKSQFDLFSGISSYRKREDNEEEKDNKMPKNNISLQESIPFYNFQKPDNVDNGNNIDDLNDDPTINEAALSSETVNADRPYEFFERLENEQSKEFYAKVEDDKNELEQKRNNLLKQSRDRIEKLKGLKGSYLNEDEFKEKWDTPAYIRKKVNLKDVPHSSEKNISRYNLNDDNQILGNNKFLHDNVD